MEAAAKTDKIGAKSISLRYFFIVLKNSAGKKG